MNERMKTQVVGFHLEGINLILHSIPHKEYLYLIFTGHGNRPFILTAKLLESAIQKQLNLEKKVKGFIYCNPNNPLGEVYNLDLTKQLLQVCAKYGIHFIADEIYALSIHGKEGQASFGSLLSIPKCEVQEGG